MKTYKSLAIITASILFASISQLGAAPVDITTADNAPAINSFNGGPYNPSSAILSNEDNETERTNSVTAIASQVWDMEAMTLNGNVLSIVGGYNMSTGLDGWKPGDLFIKIGGNVPGPGPTSFGTGTILNNVFPSGEGYSYAVDLSYAGGFSTGNGFTSVSGVASGSTKVYKLGTSSVLNTVNWDNFFSNPWTYNAAAVSTSTTSVSYTANKNASTVATLTGVGSMTNLKGESSQNATSLNHNVLQVDLSFLAGQVPVNTPVYFSYVMECGNDSVKGNYSGGFDLVPDGGLSIILLGFGLMALSLFRIRSQKE